MKRYILKHTQHAKDEERDEKKSWRKKDDAKWNKNKSCLISSTEFRL